MPFSLARSLSLSFALAFSLALLWLTAPAFTIGLVQKANVRKRVFRKLTLLVVSLFDLVQEAKRPLWESTRVPRATCRDRRARSRCAERRADPSLAGIGTDAPLPR